MSGTNIVVYNGISTVLGQMLLTAPMQQYCLVLAEIIFNEIQLKKSCSERNSKAAIAIPVLKMLVAWMLCKSSDFNTF